MLKLQNNIFLFFIIIWPILYPLLNSSNIFHASSLVTKKYVLNKFNYQSIPRGLMIGLDRVGQGIFFNVKKDLVCCKRQRLVWLALVKTSSRLRGSLPRLAGMRTKQLSHPVLWRDPPLRSAILETRVHYLSWV